MRIKSYITALILSLGISTSCSTVNQLINKNQRDTAKTENSADKKHSHSSRRGKKFNNSANAQPKTDKKINSSNIFTSTDSINISNQLAGEWYFDNVSSVKISGEENRPTLTFDYSLNRFYATNGCNYFNGDYNLSGHNDIQFKNIISTLNSCDEMAWTDKITNIWNVVAHFEFSANNSEDYLTLKDSYNRTVAILKRHQLSSLNGLWDVTEINGRKLSSDMPRINIDLIEQKIHGDSGCNIFSGTIYQNPDENMSIQFQDMAVSRLDCPALSTETAFLVALEQVANAAIIDSDTVILISQSGRHLLKLQRATL